MGPVSASHVSRVRVFTPPRRGARQSPQHQSRALGDPRSARTRSAGRRPPFIALYRIVVEQFVEVLLDPFRSSASMPPLALRVSESQPLAVLTTALNECLEPSPRVFRDVDSTT
jgi:hypothetical protein